MTLIYHHTSIAHLPWIMRDGFLTGSQPKTQWPFKDFVWFTTDPNGDRTVAACKSNQREIPRIRFAALADAAQADWESLALDQWGKDSPKYINGLKMAADKMGQTNIAGWRARVKDFPVYEIESIEVKSWETRWAIAEFKIHSCSEKIAAINIMGREWDIVRKRNIESGTMFYHINKK